MSRLLNRCKSSTQTCLCACIGVWVCVGANALANYLHKALGLIILHFFTFSAVKKSCMTNGRTTPFIKLRVATKNLRLM